MPATTTFRRTSPAWARLLAVSLGCAAVLPLPAADSGALLDALIRKGILTNQEAEDIRADLVRDSNTIPSQAMAGGKSTDRLSVGMRMQLQYAHIDTTVNGAAVKPVYVDQPFTRRIINAANNMNMRHFSKAGQIASAVDHGIG